MLKPVAKLKEQQAPPPPLQLHYAEFYVSVPKSTREACLNAAIVSLLTDADIRLGFAAMHTALLSFHLA
jgi:hypothetical protein